MALCNLLFAVAGLSTSQISHPAPGFADTARVSERFSAESSAMRRALTQPAVEPMLPVQCPYDWQSGGSLPGVSVGQVYALTTWDPDGPGPQPPVLVVGGDFSYAGGLDYQGLAIFNGLYWQPMGVTYGLGLDGALTVYQGEVIASTSPPGEGGGVARWNGTTWRSLGTGLDGGARAFAEYNGDLIVAGRFSIAGGVAANNFARWNGAAWQPLGGGLGTSPNDVVNALAIYNGELIAGGLFNTSSGVLGSSIARWNGTSWQRIGPGLTGLNAYVYALEVYNGELIAGGTFTTAGGLTVNQVARWNGTSWRSLRTGTNGIVETLGVYNGELFAGGSFTSAGGVSAKSIARWNGVAWQSLGDGMGSISSPTVYSLAVIGGDLIVGGYLGTYYVNEGVARWNGSSWGVLGGGLDAPVRALTTYNGETIAGGDFFAAGGVPLNHIGRRNGTAWQPLGTGMSGGFSKTYVYALTAFNGQLVAGGDFDTAGGISARSIACWNGSSWQALGDGVLGAVYALSVFNGELIAGGQFVVVGQTETRGVARWNGSSWQPVGSGIRGAVYAMSSFNGELIVGGNFSSTDNPPDVLLGSIARWNGSTWHPIGDVFTNYFQGPVNALEVYEGEIIAGGSFSHVGPASIRGIARWNGTSWGSVGVGVNGSVYSLRSINGGLIVGGRFESAGEANSTSIARWNGASWQSMGSGLGPTFPNLPEVYVLMDNNGVMNVGGWFLSADGDASANWALWRPVGPAISQQPANQSACPGETVAFNVAASGTGNTTYQWRRRGVNLADGAGISGSTTPALTLRRVIDSGPYDVAITDECGSTVSQSARIQLCSGAVSAEDATNILDGVNDGRDIGPFIQALVSSRPLCDAVRAYDANSDGVVDGQDVDAFVAKLLGRYGACTGY